MARGRLVLLVILAISMLPAWATAQSVEKVWQIGLFHVGLDHAPPSLDGLREGLRALGYDTGSSPSPKVSTVFEGKNIRLDWRNLADETAAYFTAQEFVRNHMDLVVAFENQTTRAAKDFITQIPVVFLHAQDPVADGFIESLARPGGNLTGFAGIGNMPAKELAMFKELVPSLRRPLVLFDRADPTSGRWLSEMRRAGVILELSLDERAIADKAGIERLFQSLKPGDVDGVILASPDLRVKFHSLILQLASERRLPMVGHREEWVAQGALFSYADSIRAIGRLAASRYVIPILRGAKPADLPVEEKAEFKFVVNLKTAKLLGLSIPPAALVLADEILQ
jgi:putative tryptophan/tyrosine transport system substrate-binding protein